MTRLTGLRLALFFGCWCLPSLCFSNDMYSITAQATVKQLKLDKALDEIARRHFKPEHLALISGSIKTAYEKKLTIETSYAMLKERFELGNDWYYLCFDWSFP